MNPSSEGPRSEGTAATRLAILPNWLGDVVMALPALRALRERGRLVAVGARPFLELLEDSALVDGGIEFERHGAQSGIGGLWRTARRCARERPAVAVVFPPGLRAALLARLSGAPRRRGLRRPLGSLLLDEQQPATSPPRSEHLSRQWLDMVGASGPDTDRVQQAQILPGETGRSLLIALRKSVPSLAEPKAFIAVAPGATYGITKRWPSGHYVALIRSLTARYGMGVVMVGSTDVEERRLCAEIAGQVGGCSVAGRTDLRSLAALLAEAALFVGNDSGPMHLAAGLGVPTVGIFGSSSPTWTAPRGPHSLAVGPHPVSCSPCFRRRCPVGLECLRDLKADEVGERIVQWLDGLEQELAHG